MSIKDFILGSQTWQETLPEVPRVTIVSAFGRGQWLASELRTLNVDVVVLDVSDSLGRWSPEDVEGPFGYFQTENLLPSQKARLDAEDYADVVEDGFSVWLKSGPFDMRGSHSRYLLDKREVPNDVVDYVDKYTARSEKERREAMSKVNSLSFAKNWLAQLAHSLASPVYASSIEQLSVSEKCGLQPLPLFAPYYLRRVSRRGAEKSWAWVKSSGANVSERAHVQNIVDDGKWLKKMRFNSDPSTDHASDMWVWMLSSAETERHSKPVFEKLFSGEVAPAQNVWLRYRIEVQDPRVTNLLPLQFLFIEDLALPWSHSQFQQVIKTATADQFDVWIRIPSLHRFEKAYIEKCGSEIIEMWQSRLPGQSLRIVDYPQEHKYDETELGPSRHVQFNVQDYAAIRRKNYINVQYDGPELWTSLDWTAQFQSQVEIFNRVRNWKTEYDVQLAKQKAKAAKLAEKMARKGVK